MICSGCGSQETISFPQTHKNGSNHIRVECAGCKKFIHWASHVKDENFIFPFGKHKGTPLRKVPKEYLVWWLCQEPKETGLKKRVERVLHERAEE